MSISIHHIRFIEQDVAFRRGEEGSQPLFQVDDAAFTFDLDVPRAIRLANGVDGVRADEKSDRGSHQARLAPCLD